MPNKDILAYRRIFVGMKSMTIIRVFLYILAGLLLLLGVIALFQAFAAPATVERLLFPYRIPFGQVVDLFYDRILSTVRSLFSVLFVLFLTGSGMAFGLARLLQRTSHQALRIQELEQKLAELKSQKELVFRQT
jgi:hypothetical protein